MYLEGLIPDVCDMVCVQCLLRSMATDLLDEVVSQPTRSWNSLLVRCTSQIPIMSRVSADVVVRKLDDCYGSLTEHPLTRSLISLRKELKHFENKLERVSKNHVLSVDIFQAVQ